MDTGDVLDAERQELAKKAITTVGVEARERAIVGRAQYLLRVELYVLWYAVALEQTLDSTL
jgi:hypothetical protein